MSEQQVTALLLAAGKGERMRAAVNKVFLPLGNRTVLHCSLQALEAARSITRVIVVAAVGERARVEETVKQSGAVKVQRIVTGGATRQQSVSKGLKAVDQSTALIAIHDAARPLVRPHLIDDVVAAAFKHGAATLAVPVKDTIKRVKGGVVVETLDRELLWATQTPQVFRRELIVQAHSLFSNEQVTDDASLVERLYPVVTVMGDYANIKITTPTDLLIAQALLTGMR